MQLFFGIGFKNSGNFEAIKKICTKVDENTEGISKNAKDYYNSNSNGYCFYRTEDAEFAFNHIFEALNGDKTPQTIDNGWQGNIMKLENSTTPAGGNIWMSLRNNGEYIFNIKEGIDIPEGKTQVKTTTTVTINSETKSLSTWGQDGYIGQIDGELYINLSKFEADKPITITVIPAE